MLAYCSEAAVEYDTDHVNDVMALIFLGVAHFVKIFRRFMEMPCNLIW